MMICFLVFAFSSIQGVGGEWFLHRRLDGNAPIDQLGFDVASIGDLNSDEVPEFLASAPRVEVAGAPVGMVGAYSGATGLPIWEFFGSPLVCGFTDFGWSVSSADVNGDNFDDILIGSPRECLAGLVIGSIFAYSGKEGSLLYRLDGVEISECFGRKVVGLGRIDMDSCDDFLVYSEDRDTFGLDFGSALIYSGKTGTLLYEIGGPWDATGRDGAGLGDINDDGWGDFIISDGYLGGSVAAYSGFDGSEIYRIVEPLPDDSFGQSTAFVGDVNLDGVGDFIVGAFEAIPRTEGRAYVYSGRDGSLLFTFIGENNDDWFGWDVAGAGDVDGDGFPDFLVGARNHEIANLETGAAYVYSGFDGRLLAKFAGDGQLLPAIGYAVASAGDQTGDGLADLIISSPGAEFNGVGSGSVLIEALNSYLQADALEISAATGGTIQFTLNFPDTEGGRTYQLLASKPNPGRIGPNFDIPLVDSPTLRQMYLNPPSIFSAPIGTLDANGDATLTMTLTPGQASAYVGNTCRFSAITYENASTLGLASATVDIEVVP